MQPLEEVKASFSIMCEEIHDKNDMSLFNEKETYISVPDWNNVIKYDIKNKTFEIVNQLENDIIMSLGPAGTGKSFLAVSVAVTLLMEKKI